MQPILSAQVPYWHILLSLKRQGSKPEKQVVYQRRFPSHNRVLACLGKKENPILCTCHSSKSVKEFTDYPGL